MSSQPFQQLQAHKDTVKDKLQGVLATVAKVPALVHAETSKESLDALPPELSAFDKVLDDALARSQDITSSLHTLKAFNSPSSVASAQALLPPAQQQQQQ